MTTTVLIGTAGNKEVAIQTPMGRMVLPPGRWMTTSIHGEQALQIKATGDFVTVAHGCRYEEEAAQSDEKATPPHQQRVIEEKAALDEKLAKLDAFFGTPIFDGLPAAERDRLTMQASIMGSYSMVLGDRIKAFPPAA